MHIKINWKNNKKFRKYLIKYKKARPEDNFWHSYEWYLFPNGYLIQVTECRSDSDSVDIRYVIDIYRIIRNIERVVHTHYVHGNIVQYFMQDVEDGKFQFKKEKDVTLKNIIAGKGLTGERSTYGLRFER